MRWINDDDQSKIDLFFLKKDTKKQTKFTLYITRNQFSELNGFLVRKKSLSFFVYGERGKLFLNVSVTTTIIIIITEHLKKNIIKMLLTFSLLQTEK